MKKTSSRNQDFHSDWLSQVDIEGPFLALPVLKDIWKDGVDRLGDADDRLLTFKQAFTRWQRALDKFAAEPRTPESKAAYAEVNHAWIYTVLDDLAEWDELRTDVEVSIQSPGEQVTVAATAGLGGRDGNAAALLLICDPTTGGLRETGMDGWPATEVDRLAMLLRKAKVEVGIVTDGQWWALVSARAEKPTGSGMFNALTWAEGRSCETRSSPSSISGGSVHPTSSSASRDCSSGANSKRKRSPRPSVPRSADPSNFWCRLSPRSV